MQSIRVKAFAKINLCLDVKGLMDDGYHEVVMIMQQIDLHDDIGLIWESDPATVDDDVLQDGSVEGVRISLGSDRDDIPADDSNLAWKAAAEMTRVYGEGRRGSLEIGIEKRIPMAAGLAGGSSDCAAVIHGLNRLWDLGLDVGQLCSIGASIGSDVPFCIMGQAAADPAVREDFRSDPFATHCAIARGRGTDLEPIAGLDSYIALIKPDIGVSTAEVYRGIDGEVIEKRPDIEEMRMALEKKDMLLLEKNMVNVLENFTLKRYPVVVYTKNKVQGLYKGPVLMSGSGPTIFCLCKSREEADRLCEKMRAEDMECCTAKATTSAF